MDCLGPGADSASELISNLPARWSALGPALAQALSDLTTRAHGDWPAWRAALAAMPRPVTEQLTLDQGLVSLGVRPDTTPEQRLVLEQSLKVLHPWRKGPFLLHGVLIDSEWRSDWKWERLAPHISPLGGRSVLDIGCGNGYYMLRMLGEGAASVLGIDPTQLFHAQYSALAGLLSASALGREALRRAWHLPLGVEALPRTAPVFDSAFSMGVLYHRRDPLEHLSHIHGLLVPGGELVLETLVLPNDPDEVLIPGDRYARMRNVWAVPGTGVLRGWVAQAGFEDVRVVDVTRTSTEEQRATGWMTFQSLADFLDPENPELTVEGHPAPHRALLVACKPG